MSETPESGRTDAVTCPRCWYSFVPAQELVVVAPPVSGTVSMSPDEPAKTPAVPTPSPVPTQIGRFTVRRFLGEGSFGRVYEAYDSTLKRVVALKVAKAEQMGGPKRVARFQREARAAANLMHPHIVAVFDSGEDGGQHYIATAFVAGRSLDAAITGGAGDVRSAVQIVRKLAEALAYAHREGVVHRDVKPGNVMLREDGEPMLMDFGLAARLDETEKLSVAGQFMGTPEYCAPEQWRGQASAASDQYSLGCLLFEMLTAEKPFAGASAEHYLMLHTTQPAPSPRKYRPELPPDLENITRKCLEKDEAQRYADCRALADDLRKWLEGEPVSARQPGLAERGVRWARKNPAVAALSATVLLVFALGATVATVFGLQALDYAEKERTAAGLANEKTAEAKREAGEKQEALLRAREETKKAEQATADEKRTRHIAAMGRHGFMLTAAWQAWQQNDLVTAEAILDEVPMNLQQTWEYRHVRGLIHRKTITFRGHRDDVLSVAFSPDGKHLVSGSGDRTVRVWDAYTGETRFALTGHANKVLSVAIGVLGTRLVSGSADQTVKVWDAATGKELRTLSGHASSVESAAISADGGRIASGSADRTVKVWDAKTGQLLHTLAGHTLAVQSVAFSPDGSRIVSASADRTARVWDTTSGRLLFVLEGHADEIASCGFSPDGSRIVTGSWDYTSKVWDAESGRELLALKGHTNRVTSVAFSPDGLRIASASRDNTLIVWDAKTSESLLTLRGHSYSVQCVAFSPDGSRIASGSLDNTAKVWDTQVGQELLTIPAHTVLSVAVSPDGLLLASGGIDPKVKFWEAKYGQLLFTLPGHDGSVESVCFRADSARLVSGGSDRTVRVWDVKNRKNLLTLRGHTGKVTSVVYSADGKQLVSGSADRTANVWDVRTGSVRFRLTGHAGSVESVAIDADGSRIASGSADRTVKVWDAKTGQLLHTLTGHVFAVQSVAFSPDGSRIVSASADRTARVWDAATGQELLTLKGHMNRLSSVAYSPDGSRIVTGCRDNMLKVWDARTGQDLLTLKGHTFPVSSVAFLADGKRILSGGWDKTLKVWNAKSGLDSLMLEGHADTVWSVAINRDGSHIFGRDSVGNVIAWESSAGTLLSPAPEMPPSPGMMAIHGNRRVYASGNVVRVERIPTAQECVEAESFDAHVRLRAARAFHEAALARTARTDRFAATFHLDRLLALAPDSRAALLERRSVLLADSNTPWTTRRLARQAIADLSTLDDPNSLLACLARHPTAPRDRLYGTLLLRTGNVRDAALVLRAAIRHRPPNTPPIDELLLAQALLALKRPDEARQHLKIATDWMDAGTAAPRAAALAGLGTAGPLATLGAFAHAPDPRLNPLDPFTGHELATLRSQVERALATR